MTAPAFFDTNVLVYADDAASPRKQDRAIQLIANHQKSGQIVVSLQVIQEYFAAATRKLGIDAELAQRKVQILARGRVIRFEPNDVIAAIELHRLTRISFWDALIVHAARLAGAAVIYSEDFQHDCLIGGMRIANPFLSA